MGRLLVTLGYQPTFQDARTGARWEPAARTARNWPSAAAAKSLATAVAIVSKLIGASIATPARRQLPLTPRSMLSRQMHLLSNPLKLLLRPNLSEEELGDLIAGLDCSQESIVAIGLEATVKPMLDMFTASDALLQRAILWVRGLLRAKTR
jgi:hypothetical protein